MTPVYMFALLMFSFFMQLPPVTNGEGNGQQENCPPSFDCGIFGKIKFPFTKAEQPNCGIIAIQNCDVPGVDKMIQLGNKERWFVLIALSQTFPYSCRIDIRDQNLSKSLQSRSCNGFIDNYTLPISSPLASFQISDLVTLFRCNRTLNVKTPVNLGILNYSCPHHNIYYGLRINQSRSSFTKCSMIQLPGKDLPDDISPFTFITAGFAVDIGLSSDCTNCLKKNGHCQLDWNKKFYCDEGEKKALRLGLGLWLGLGYITKESL